MQLKMKQELASMKSPLLESDPENSDEYETEEEFESDEEVLSSVICDTSKGKFKTNSFADAYFTAQKQKSCTSNKTLSNLKLEQVSIQDMIEILQNIPENHIKEKQKLFDKYCLQFDKWNCLLRNGFNILLYGIGSKYNLLKAFCEKVLENEYHIEVHGFVPSLSIKEILCIITEEVLEHDGKFSSVQDHCNYIKDHFMQCEDSSLYVIIHSLDGFSLRSEKCQSLLSGLAAVPNICFVCSVDHINTPLLWDQKMLSCFQWVWYDTTTFEPYIYETSYENSLLREQSSHLMLSSLLHVYNSLTPNSRGVFLILAKYQKEQKKSSNSGLTFHEWYQECREAFLVNSEITMQAQLSEFKNHKLLTSRKNADGVELWYIPVDDATLHQFLENIE